MFAVVTADYGQSPRNLPRKTFSDCWNGINNGLNASPDIQPCDSTTGLTYISEICNNCTVDVFCICISCIPVTQYHYQLQLQLVLLLIVSVSLSVCLVSESANRGHLRSVTWGDLAVPRSRTTRYGQRCFAVSGPTLWNSLPLSARDPSLTLTQFCARLKTVLFCRAYETLA